MTQTTSSPTKALTNVSAAERTGTANKGKSFSAPALFSWQKKTLQLFPNSKQSIKQPDIKDQSKDIPDLPSDIVKSITGVPGSKKDGQLMLDELVKYLILSGIVDDPKRTIIEYIHSDGSGKYGLTEITGTGDSDPVKVKIYRSAFKDGAATVYSTVRHELIHVGQRLLVPDEKEADSKDDYMHENIYDKDVGVSTTKTIQINLQEIETHTWEILHSKETGVNEKYIEATIKDLFDYSTALIKNIPKLDKTQFLYWKGYFKKAIDMLIETMNYTKIPAIKDVTEELIKVVSNFKTN